MAQPRARIPVIGYLILANPEPVFGYFQDGLLRKIAAGLALQHRLPAFSPLGPFPDEGGLMSYSPKQEDMHREAASYVHRILNDAKPTG